MCQGQPLDNVNVQDMLHIRILEIMKSVKMEKNEMKEQGKKRTLSLENVSGNWKHRAIHVVYDLSNKTWKDMEDVCRGFNLSLKMNSISWKDKYRMIIMTYMNALWEKN